MTRRRLLAAVLPVTLAWPLAGAAQEAPALLSGSAQLGFRLVDVNGRTEKYKEDVNLEAGPRLFKMDLSFVPPAELRGAVDKVEIDFQNVGGDPFESFHVGAKKAGRYAFKYDRHKSNYFYDDVILPPELASVSLSNGGDFHKFDFDRVRDTASLRIQTSKSTRLTVGLDRFTKKGSSTTTLDIQRDEFELDQAIDESMNEYHAAFEYTTRKVTFVLEERIRQYDNAVEIFLPGQSQGENAANFATLDSFFLDRPYSFDSYTHTGRLTLHPSQRFSLKAAASLNHLDLTTDVAEHSKGTSFAGAPFTTAVSGRGEVARDIDQFDFDLAYALSSHVTVVASASRQQLDQAGAIGLEGAAGGEGEWSVDTSTAEAGLEVQAGQSLTLSGGFRLTKREVGSAWERAQRSGATEGDTENVGGFASLGWRPTRKLRVTVGFEEGNYTGPYTLASPTGLRTFRFRGQYGGGQGLSLSAAVRMIHQHNDDSGWHSVSDQLNARLGYRVQSLSVSLGYSRVELERHVDQRVNAAGVAMFVPVDYAADSDNFDGRMIWSFREGWRVGGSVRFYDGKGSFAVRRNDLGGWLEAELGRHYIAHVGYRGLDYEEARRHFDDYDARIAEVSIGYRW